MKDDDFHAFHPEYFILYTEGFKTLKNDAFHTLY